jgi:acetyltransferase-like isoleucine patch superfamily enzyme
MRLIVNNIIILLGRNNYNIDSNISNFDLFKIIFRRIKQLLRGLFLKIRFKSSKGLVFKGKNVKIFHANKITVGRTFIVQDNVFINALCEDGVKIGDNVTIQDNTTIECTGVINKLGEGLIIGNNVGIAHNCFIQVRGTIVIGSNVIFGPGVYLFSENHNFKDPSVFINEQGTNRKGTIVGDGVWIGARSVILDGVNIGNNSIVAAGSVVTKNIPDFEIWGGSPAKKIRSRKKTL